MLVELYTEQETNTNNKEEMELHLDLAKELGLSNQQTLHSPAGVDGYRKMSAEEQFVFAVHFPNSVELSQYKSLIPIRVLIAIKEFKNIHPTLGIYLLCPEPGKVDPIVVGCQYSWSAGTDGLLIARFGEALEEFSVLSKQALEILKKKVAAVDMWEFRTAYNVYKQVMG
jgi:hypothetical protein